LCLGVSVTPDLVKLMLKVCYASLKRPH
jgi:hypothetical protein